MRSHDTRVTDAQGKVSPTRLLVVEALEAQGKDGATLAELTALIGDEIGGKRPQGGIGQVLSYMQTEEHVIQQGNRWYLTEYAPKAGKPPVSPNGGKTVAIAPFMGKRTEKTLSIYSEPEILTDIIGLQLLMHEHWYPVTVFDHAHICVGFNSPSWSPEQVMYNNVTVMKFLHKGGKVSEREVNPNFIVTIAPEE